MPAVVLDSHSPQNSWLRLGLRLVTRDTTVTRMSHGGNDPTVRDQAMSPSIIEKNAEEGHHVA